MEPATPRDLCNALARSNLHPPDEVRALLKRFEEEQATSREEVVSFARWLMARGKLSDFQSALLLKGRWERLKVDDYVLVDRIGQGRLAGVYEARHRLGQRVAVKILPPSKVGDPQIFGRFQRETRLARKLKHPNVVRTFQSGEANGLHYLVMEYLDGETLDDVLKRRGHLPAQEAVRLVHQALLGLQHLHEEGMVHRDLTPVNLMLVPSRLPGRPDTTEHATVKLLEIGLGRALFDEGDPAVGAHDENLTAAGDLLGTPDYMAPEQARDAHAADIRCDIYALGCVLYHTLTGQVPFPDKNMVQKMVKHATEMPKRLAASRPELPEGLQAILDWMMAKDPAQRYPTPDRAAQALQVFLLAGEEPARPLEADADMAAYLRWLQARDALVATAVPVAMPVIEVERVAVPPNDTERVLGLTIREWTLMGVAAAALVVFTVACFIGFRMLRG